MKKERWQPFNGSKDDYAAAGGIKQMEGMVALNAREFGLQSPF